MLIRVSLIVAIIGGLTIAGVNCLRINQKIKVTIAERNRFHSERDQESSEKLKMQKLAGETRAQLEKTSQELAITKVELEKSATLAEAQARQARMFADKLKTSNEERDRALDQLAPWNALGMPVNHVAPALASLRSVIEERDALESEKKILLQEMLRHRTHGDRNPTEGIPLPAGLRGTVLVSDPKYDFVVLDIGEAQGALTDGQMLVNRKGKLVAKVVIQSVQRDRCIANVMPGWKLDQVAEGDQVIY